jgi:recombination protein RecA
MLPENRLRTLNNNRRLTLSVQPSEEKLAAVRKVVEDINKRFGDGSIMRLRSATHMNVDVISTGSLAIDIASGIGGIPRGRVTEIYGPESSGKTTLCQHIIAQAQKKGESAAFIDMEHALDPSYASKIGVNVEDLWVSQPSTGEQALEIAEALIRTGSLSIVVVDSVASLVPASELEGDMGDASVGVQARLMSSAMRKLTPAVASTGTALVFTNQLRQKIGVMFGNPEVTSGGQALKFYASMRIDVRRIQALKVGGDTVGNRTRARFVKNKLAPPFRVAEFDILYNQGISLASDILDIGSDMGVVTKSGAYYSYGDLKLGHGKDAARDELNGNPNLMQMIYSEIMEKRSEGAESAEESA